MSTKCNKWRGSSSKLLIAPKNSVWAPELWSRQPKFLFIYLQWIHRKLPALKNLPKKSQTSALPPCQNPNSLNKQTKPQKYLHHLELLALYYPLAWSEKATTSKIVISEMDIPIHPHPPNTQPQTHALARKCEWVRKPGCRLQVAFFPFYLTQSSLKKSKEL